MHAFHALRKPLQPGQAAHRALVWLLIAALVAYACSAATLRMLGPAHWHALPSASTGNATPHGAADTSFTAWRDWLAGIRALGERLHASGHALGLPAHAHSHGHDGVLRHWHAPHDDSVRALGHAGAAPELADQAAAAALGTATLLLAPGPCGPWPCVVLANGSWPPGATPRWRNADPAPALDPPIA